MAFDATKVNWTADELSAAEGLDKVYEGLKDGVDMEDIMLILEVQPLWNYLQSATREEYASKLMALAVMLVRDNLA